MAKFQILKDGETDIDSTDIWRFAVHSDYKNQKTTEIYSTTVTLPAGSTWLGGEYGYSSVYHGFGRLTAYYAEVYFNGKSYPISGSVYPQIPVVSTDPGDPFYDVGAKFSITNGENYSEIYCSVAGFGETATSNTFTVRFRFIVDDIV